MQSGVVVEDENHVMLMANQALFNLFEVEEVADGGAGFAVVLELFAVRRANMADGEGFLSTVREICGTSEALNQLRTDAV